jgi:hypothetical protein
MTYVTSDVEVASGSFFVTTTVADFVTVEVVVTVFFR